MNLFFYHILSLVEFIIVILIGIALVSFLLHYVSNKFNLKFINIYGFFSNMDNLSLIMLSGAILKQITLIYCLFRLNNLLILYLFVLFAFSLIYSLSSLKISVIIKEFLISGIECLIIYFLNLLYSFLIDVRYSNMVIIYICILSFLLACCSIYFFSRNLSTILMRDKNLRRNLDVEKN